MKKIFFLSIFLFGAVFMSLGNTYACSCMRPADPLTSMEQSDSVFAGSVTNISTTDFQKTITFDVEKSWKSANLGTISISTADSSAACGYNFVEDEEYIVYALKKEDGTLNTSLCSRTAQLQNAQEDLNILNSQRNTGAEGEFCGGIANLQCQSELICNITETYPDAGGTCIVEEATFCTMQYDPVCGVDGKTYGNSCIAGKNPVAYAGECSSLDKITQLENSFDKNILSILDKNLNIYTLKVSSKSKEEQNSMHQKIIDKASETKMILAKKYNSLNQSTLRQKIFDLIELLQLKVAAMIS